VRNRALALFLVLGLATVGAPQPPVGDPDVRRGIALVDEGEYDSAILALDAAVRRLAADKGHSTADLAEAYFYLGVAYLGKGHETSAKARFREAVQQARDMSPSPEKFPPRVIELFEKARDEARAERPAVGTAASTSTVAEPKKKGGSKALLVIGGVALAGGGAAVALGGGGGGGGGGTPTTQSAPSTSRTESGAARDQEQVGFLFVASRAGTMEATVTWQDRAVALQIDCQEEAPPYTGCAGTFNRTTDTSARYTASVTQRQYLVLVSNYSGRAGAEPFTLTLRYP
jgi:tetratricopeptide (TPR) repeat protein